jgi:hypothetical protein
MNIHITGWAGGMDFTTSADPLKIPVPFFKTNSVCFQADYTDPVEIQVDPPPLSVMYLGSPCELRVYDSEGRVTGLIGGSVVEQIPDSAYDAETEAVIVIGSEYINECELKGIDDGSYEFMACFAIADEDPVIFVARSIPVSDSTTHQYLFDWESLSSNAEGVTLDIDADGDGTFETTIASDNELTADEVTTDDFSPVPIDDLVDISLGRMRYDRRTGQFILNATVANSSARTIVSPIYLVVDNISNPAVTLANGDGTTEDGKEYIDLSGLLGDDELEPGESIVTSVCFNNSSRVRFTCDFSVRGIPLPTP